MARKRRKAVDRLVKSVENSEKTKDTYENIKKLIEDPDWSVRAKTIISLSKLALYEKTLREDTVSLLEKKAMNSEEHPNVVSASLRGLYTLLESEKSLKLDASTIIEENLEHENDNIKIETLQLSKSILKHRELTETLENKILELVDSENQKIREKILELLSETYGKFSDTESLEKILMKGLRDQSFKVRETALMTIRDLYPLEISNERLKTLLRTRLRDRHIKVKKATVKCIFRIIKHYPRLSEAFLGEVSEEILLKTKNEALLLLTLHLLEGVIQEIPTPVINKYNIPKTLDTLACNVPANSLQRKKIKRKAQHLLEGLLSYSVEERREMRGKKR